MNIRRLSLMTGAQQAEGLPIVIDVLRAFTTSAVLFALGLERLILVDAPEEAFALRQRHGWLLGGERGGVKIEGFDYGNSPTELLRAGSERFRGQTLVLRTSSGTRGVAAAIQRSPAVILGSLVMAGAIATYVKQSGAETVSIVAMGSHGVTPGIEDEVCGEMLEQAILGQSYDWLDGLRRCLNDAYIQQALQGGLDYLPPDDIVLCLQPDLFDFVLVAQRRDGLIEVDRVPVSNPKAFR
ncbi:MAG: 2-phosphosulfolactate phosphatase [Anaerolineae bacterium]|nr:2-phosphosulfolactate phosphatase [Anaerolineae bacterium]